MRLQGFVWGAALAVLVMAGSRPTVAEPQDQLRAGDRRGNRVYNGKYWVDAVAEATDTVKPTTSWEIASFPTDGMYRPVRVIAIETSGVCIYLTRNWSTDGGNALAAVPKTQLRPGQGCQ